MDDAGPSAAGAVAEKKRPRLRRVPTSLIVTVVGIALTAWLLPALTRQWDDRQKAHELKVALVSEMSLATAEALTDGRDTLFRRSNVEQSKFTKRLGIVPMTAVERNWSIASLQLQSKL